MKNLIDKISNLFFAYDVWPVELPKEEKRSPSFLAIAMKIGKIASLTQKFVQDMNRLASTNFNCTDFQPDERIIKPIKFQEGCIVPGDLPGDDTPILIDVEESQLMSSELSETIISIIQRSSTMEKREKILKLVTEIVDIMLDSTQAEATTAPTKEDAETRKSFTSKNPPSGKKEVDLFKKQWAELSTDQQTQYAAGECDSLGNAIEGVEVKNDAGKKDSKKANTKKAADLDDVKAALKTFIEENGRDAAVEKLDAFKAKSIKDIKKKDFQKFIDSLSESQSTDENEDDLFG